MTLRKALSVSLVLLALAAGPGLFIAGAATVFADPCFFRQFPPPGCPVADVFVRSPGWPLIIAGLVVLGVVSVAALANSQSKGRGRS